MPLRHYARPVRAMSTEALASQAAHFPATDCLLPRLSDGSYGPWNLLQLMPTAG